MQIQLRPFQHVTAPPEAQKNFLVVDAKTDISTIEQAFENFTHHRKDIAILFINQHVSGSLRRWIPVSDSLCKRRADHVLLLQIAEKIRGRVDTYTDAFPAVLEIPSKDHPYDPEKDSVLRRVRRLFGE